ncbi:MAG: DUF424 family protein [Desulfurococcaceae archaeon]
MSSIKVYVKVHEIGDNKIVAICDAIILGTVLRDNEKNISFYVDPQFFKGELMDLDDVENILSSASSANLVGKAIVEFAVKKGYIHPEAILIIDKTPLAMFTRV